MKVVAAPSLSVSLIVSPSMTKYFFAPFTLFQILVGVPEPSVEVFSSYSAWSSGAASLWSAALQ